MTRVIPSKQKQYVDPETGEVVNTIAIIPEARDDNFVKVFKLMTTKVIKDLHAGIDGAVYTLLWFIDRVQEMQPNQDPIMFANPEAIAEDLGINERTVRRHLTMLKKHGYIEQIRERHHVYRIDPTMIYKGTLQKYFDKESDRRRKKESKEVEVEQAPYISPDELSEAETEEAEEVEEEVEAGVFSGLIYLGSDKSSDKSKEQEGPRKRGKGKSVLLLE